MVYIKECIAYSALCTIAMPLLAMEKSTLPSLPPAYITIKLHDSDEPLSVSRNVYKHIPTLNNAVNATQNASSPFPLPLFTQTWHDMQATIHPVLESMDDLLEKAEHAEVTYTLQNHCREYFRSQKSCITRMAHFLQATNYLGCDLFLDAINDALAYTIVQSPKLLKSILKSKKLKSLSLLPAELEEKLLSTLLHPRQGAVQLFYMPESKDIPAVHEEMINIRQEKIQAMQFNQAGTQLFIATNDTIHQWALAPHTLLHRFTKLGQNSFMKLSPDDTFLMTQGENNTLQVWNIDTKKVIRTLHRTAQIPLGITWGHGNKLVACHYNDGNVYIYSLTRNPDVPLIVPCDYREPCVMAFSPNNTYFAIGSALALGPLVPLLCIWDIVKQKCLASRTIPIPVAKIQLTNEEVVAHYQNQGPIIIWDMHSSRDKIIGIPEEGCFNTFDISIDEGLLRTISPLNYIKLYNIKTGTLERTIGRFIDLEASHDESVTYNDVAALSPCGTQCATWEHSWKPIIIHAIYSTESPETLEPPLTFVKKLTRHNSLAQALLTTYAYQRALAGKKSTTLIDRTPAHLLLKAYNNLPEPIKKYIKVIPTFFDTIQAMVLGQSREEIEND